MALEGIVCQHLTVARVADGLGVAWNTANDAVLAEGKRALIDEDARFDGVTDAPYRRGDVSYPFRLDVPSRSPER